MSEEVDPIQYQCKKCEKYFAVNSMREPISSRVCKNCPKYSENSPWRDFRVFVDLYGNEILVNIREIVLIHKDVDNEVLIHLTNGKSYKCKGTIKDITTED